HQGSMKSGSTRMPRLLRTCHSIPVADMKSIKEDRCCQAAPRSSCERKSRHNRKCRPATLLLRTHQHASCGWDESTALRGDVVGIFFLKPRLIQLMILVISRGRDVSVVGFFPKFVRWGTD